MHIGWCINLLVRKRGSWKAIRERERVNGLEGGRWCKGGGGWWEGRCCCAVSLGSDYGAWCRVTVCRLSCTATLILSINKHRSTLPSRTTFINHNLSAVLRPTLGRVSLPPALLPSLPLAVHLSLAFHLSSWEIWSSILKACSPTTPPL